jgi:8-hydroxy-5-deazaflavin:NADPH oxidoreductase
MTRPVAIIGGTGAEGFGLALRWARAGKSIVVGSRDAERARHAAEQIKQKVGANAEVSGEENIQACVSADIVVLTIPFEHHAATLKQLKSALRPGTIVVDATVPLAASVGGRATRTLGLWEGSVAQQTAETLPKEVSVVSAFHNISSELLKGDDSIDCDVIVCGDNAQANLEVRKLAAEIPGIRAVDGGKLENTRIVEQIAALLIGFNIRNKGHHCGIRITGLPDAAYRSWSGSG